jgi:magnesium transporter
MALQNINHPPGTFVYTGEYKEQKTILSLISYNEENASEEVISELNDIFANEKICWLNITGFNDLNIIKKAGETFNINDLMMEDILNVNHRSKIELEDNKLFAILKMVYVKNEKIVHEHISILVTNGFLITFQESEGDVFDSLRERIKTGKGNVRKLKIDYLFYAMVDAVVDHYYSALSIIEYDIDEIEELVINLDKKVMDRIYSLKKELIFLRSSILPLRDIIKNIMEEDVGIINDVTKVYYKDLNDHLTEISDKLMLCRELTNSLNEAYSSNINNNMNKVMTILTVFSALFIPLSFLTGFFGMNFSIFPGIDYKYGVHVFIVSCLVISGFMIRFIKKKRWF